MSDTPPAVPFSHAYWVIPNMLLAGEHPSESTEDLSRVRLCALLDVGIRTFIDLTVEEELPFYGKLLREVAEDRRCEISLVKIGVRDRSLPSAWTVRRALDVIDGSISDGQPVFVHCWAGLGRAGSIVGCYLQRHGFAAAQDVLEKIADLRRFVPGGSASSPQTAEQIEMVRSWPKGR